MHSPLLQLHLTDFQLQSQMRPVLDGLTLAQHDSSHATVELGRMSALLG